MNNKLVNISPIQKKCNCNSQYDPKPFKTTPKKQ